MAFFRQVLLLDDDPVALYVQEHWVKNHQLSQHLHSCQSARQAQEVMQQWGIGHPPEREELDLLLVDIHMPDMDGLEFLADFFALPAEERQNVCLFVLTTSTHSTDREKALSYPICGYLNKPFTDAQIQCILACGDRKRKETILFNKRE